jgi:4-hydroxy-tetrahydrodipicolinate reductase
MAADAAKVLGSEYDIEIVEAHHIHKKDSPSGTAKEIARVIKDARGDVNIPIESIREDEIVGEHTVIFESDVDLLEITHSAKTRDIFAKGALKAAKFIVGKPAGLYTMKDVLLTRF